MTGPTTRRRFLSGLAVGTAATAAVARRGLAGGDRDEAGRSGATAVDEDATTGTASRFNWPMFGQDPTNTGETGSDGPRDGVAIGWEADVSAATPPAVTNNTVYVGTSDGVSALAADSGDESWSTSTDSPVVTCPAVAGNLVHVGTEDGTVHAFSTSEGESQWTRELDARVASAPAVLTGRDQLFVADESGSVFQLEALSGIVAWRNNIDGAVTGSVAAANDNTTVYVPGPGPEIYGLDLRTGDVRWSNGYKANSLTTPALGGELGYVGDDRGTLHEFSARGGKNWERDLDGSVQSVPAYSNDVVFAATDRGSVHAFETGGDVSERWQSSVGGAVRTAPVVSGGATTLYVGDDTGTVTAFDVSNGEERWSAQLSVGTPRLAIADGSVFAAGDGVVALESGSRTQITTRTPTPTPTATPTQTPTATSTPTPTPGGMDTSEPTTTTPPPNDLTTTQPSTEAPDQERTPTATSTPTPTPVPDAGDGAADTTTSGSGDLAPWVTLAAIGGLAALGVRADDETDET